MRIKTLLSTTVLAAIFIAAGCNSNVVDKNAFRSAINDYYGTKPECLWSNPMKFPAQADTSNEEQTKGFDALTDAGILTRSSAEKKRFLIGSKQVNNYDLSDKGRSVWTADPAQPGYGNFCFGHRKVASIDSFTPSDTNAQQYTVNYHYVVTDIPDWAATAEMKSGFPNLAADTSGQQTATATLVKSNNGWQVNSVQPANPGATPAP